ncbi:MAG: hypothetical protein OHK0022_22090 [Roseiflexaceae bacterium]
MTLSDNTLSWVDPIPADTSTHIIIWRADRRAAVVLPYEWKARQRHFPLATDQGEQPAFQLLTGKGWEVIEPLPPHVLAFWTQWCEDRPGIPRAVFQSHEDIPVLNRPAPGWPGLPRRRRR